MRTTKLRNPGLANWGTRRSPNLPRDGLLSQETNQGYEEPYDARVSRTDL
jgi:hypothetical protein